MLKNNYDVAMIMQRRKIYDGLSIYVPVQSILGNYSEDEGFFYSSDGTSYEVIDEFVYDFDDDVSFICDFVLSKKDFNDKYKNQKNMREALMKYRLDYSNCRVNRYDMESDETKSFIIDIDDLFSDNKPLNNNIQSEGNEVINVKENIVPEAFEITPEFEEMYFTELIKRINSHAMTKKEMLELNKIIIVTRDHYNNLIDTIARVTEIEEESLQAPAVKSTSDSKENNKEELYLKRKNIIKKLKDIIIGQDDEIDQLVTEIFRLQNNQNGKNKGILLSGSTGVGNSRICTLLAKYLDIPCKIIDTTQLTMPGYRGQDIEDFLEQLYMDEGQNLERVEKAIIVFDEVDKKGSRDNYDVSGKGVLNQLLKFLDGTEYTIGVNEGSVLQKNKVRISTNNMMVIFSGAFSNVYNASKFTKNNLGFRETNTPKSKEPTLQDFIDIGCLPDESMGRLPIIIHLNTLSENDLKNILLHSKESDIYYVKQEFKNEAEVDIEFSDEAIEEIAHQAYLLQTGARSLQKIVHDATYHAFKKVTDDFGKYSKVIITKDTITDHKNYTLIPKKQNKVLQKNKKML